MASSIVLPLLLLCVPFAACASFGAKEGKGTFLVDNENRTSRPAQCHGRRYMRSESTGRCVKVPPGFDESCIREMNENKGCDPLGQFVAVHCSKTCGNFSLFNTVHADLLEVLRYPNIPVGKSWVAVYYL